MENNKSNKKIIVVLLVILILLVIGIGVNFFLFRKKVQMYNTGHFEIRNGVETYVESGQVVINSLVDVDGKLYYVDENGHKVKDKWAVIDNDGNYGYFGSLGDLVVGKIREIDGKLYYFDENGKLYIDRTSEKIITIEGTDYKANKNGELRLSTEVETTVANTTAPVRQTIAATVIIPQTTAVPVTTQPIISQTATQPIAQTNPPISNVVAPAETTTQSIEELGPGAGISANVANDKETKKTSGEVKLLKTETITDSIDGEDYECKITLLKPIMSGATDEETILLNESMEEATDILLDEINTYVEKQSSFPKAVAIKTVTLGTVNTKSIMINLAGTVTTKTGSSKPIKYRFTYNREDETVKVTKISG